MPAFRRSESFGPPDEARNPRFPIEFRIHLERRQVAIAMQNGGALPRWRVIGRTAGFALLLAACAPTAPEGSALARGDEAWARGEIEEALAEYRLALRQGGDIPESHIRVAHALVTIGRVDEARAHYQAARSADPRWADQGASDLIRLARKSAADGDRFRVAQAVQLASELRPGVAVRDLALPLARHHSGLGDHARAIPYLQEALASADAGTSSDLTWELGIAHEQIGDCARAVVFFEQFREMRPRWDRGEVDFHVGSCTLNLAMQARRSGDPDGALALLERVVQLGEPRTQMPRAWFELGELRLTLGQCEEALDAFRRVAPSDGSGNSPLVQRARERMDELRFGRRSPFSETAC